MDEYKKYGITYNKTSDTLQYKGKNIAGLIIHKPGKNGSEKDKNNEFAASETEIYTNSDAGKDGAYFIINRNGDVKEITKKEFKKNN